MQPLSTVAQKLDIKISARHEKKLSLVKSGHKRMMKYYRYHRKDSAKASKEREKKYTRRIDSAYKAELKNDRHRKRLLKKGIALPAPLKQIDTVDVKLSYWYGITNDSCSSSDLRKEARDRVKLLALEKAKLHPGFQQLMDGYQSTGDSVQWEELTRQVPGIDTLSSIYNSSAKELIDAAERQGVLILSEHTGSNMIPSTFTEVNELKNLPDKYKQSYGEVTNQEKIKSEGKDKALDEAIEYFSKYTERLDAAQAKVSALLSKYQAFSNSNDLSAAKKHTSMEGKTFFEHLVFGGNFNVVSTDPVSLDFSPMLGYKFTMKFWIGVAMNYRHTFADSIRNNWYISPVNTSYKAFANYDIIKRFFAYGEWERSGIQQKGHDKSRQAWKNNYFIGAGKKYLVHPKVYLTTILLYNLNNEKQNPVHPSRFQVKIGFQLSELATRKKQTYYNPNRQ